MYIENVEKKKRYCDFDGGVSQRFGGGVTAVWKE